MSDYTFTKLFNSITKSTVWCEPHTTLRVWITMLADCDRNGCVYGSIPGLANLARVTVEECELAIATFLAPDRYSRTPDHEGRRIEVIADGWRLLNYHLYRDKRDEGARRDQNREAQQRYRGRQQPSAEMLTNADSKQKSANSSAQEEAEEEALKAEKQKALVQPTAARCRFEDFWREYPNKKGKQEAEKTWRKRKLDAVCDDLIAHVYLMTQADSDWQRGYVPMGSTYLNQARWEDEPKRPPTAGPPVAAQSKTLAAIQRFEGMKNGLVGDRTTDRLSETPLLEFGTHARR